MDTAGREQSGLSVSQRGIAQARVGPEAQHSAGKLLVVNVE
ncbi:hypothetical protein [Streptomyces chartreusis]|nr:hypothetical protein [Streptomyces chartreusis]